MTRIAVSTLSAAPMALSMAQLALLVLMFLVVPVAAFAHAGAVPWHAHGPGGPDLTRSAAPWIAAAFVVSLGAAGATRVARRARAAR